MNVNELFSPLHLPVESRMPAFDGANGWLNTEPLTPADAARQGRRRRLLDVHVHQLAADASVHPRVGRHVRRQGLVVIGVHTPEFGVEHDIDNVRRAVRDMGIEYPVAIDNDYAVWNAFANQYWPALYIADAEGRIRHHQFGEGGYEKSERVIRQLLDGRRRRRPAGRRRRRSRRAASKSPPTGTTCGRPRPTSASPGPKASPRPAAPRSTSRACTRCRRACTSTSGRSRATGRSAAKRR